MKNWMRLYGGQYVFSSGVRINSRVLPENTAKNSSTALSSQYEQVYMKHKRGTCDDRVSLIKQCN